MLVSVRMAHLQKVLILKPVVSIYFRCFYLGNNIAVDPMLTLFANLSFYICRTKRR